MKNIETWGDNTQSYTAQATKAAAAYKRHSGKAAASVEIRDRNGYVSFVIYNAAGQEVALYGLENGRIVKGYAQ